MKKTILTLSSLALLGIASAAFAADGLKAEPLKPRAKGSGKTLFTEMPADQTGVTIVNKMDVNHPLNFLYHSGMTCGGVAVADFDGDGKPDIFFCGSTMKHTLYRQTGDLKFEDITTKAGIAKEDGVWSAGVGVADVNGDGRPDIYICNYMKPNQLYLNMGPGKNGEPVVFKECAKAAGLDAVDCSHSVAFADYDGDGKMDMYLLTNRIEDPAGTPSELPIDKHPDGTVTIKPGMEKYYQVWRYDYDNWGTEAIGTPDRLFHNDGNGPDGIPTFTDATAKAGISGRGDGLSVMWWDYNMDGKMDIYVANDFIAPDKLYRNNGDGTFTDVAAEALPHCPWFAMGADMGDVNNDLLPDFLVADMSATSHYKSKTTMGVMGGIDLKRAYRSAPMQIMQNALYLNTGAGRFREAARMFKVSSTDWTWAVKFADFDNDGWQDLYFTNGISRHMNNSDTKITADMLKGKHMFEYFKEGEMRKEQHRAYKNTAHYKFDEVSKEWGLDKMGVAYGAAYADLNGDGDLDLVVVNLEEPNSIYRNDSQEGHRITISLAGTKSNALGIGSTVIIRSKSGAQMRQLQPQSGYLSFNQPIIHFGLGKDDTIDELTVRWVGGGEQKFTNLKADMHYTITQPAGGGEPVPPAPKTEAMFVKSDVLAGSVNKDKGWDEDFKKQILLPHSLAQLGPCLAWGDVNGDGIDDYYFGASAGEIGELRLGDGKGKYTAKWVDAFEADKDCEDQGAVFFDANGDGALDLLVASGSSEFEAGGKENRTRLYLNDGKGNFTAAPKGSLPESYEFSSAVCAVDFDHDGKTDVFIGARAVPGDYPHKGRSRLLHNETKNGVVKFVDVTDSVAGLADVGLVTAAMWTDLDGDGWSDLIVACEWGPVKYFHNAKGKLADQTETAGLAGVTGWWRGLAVADVNHDGQLDILVTNIGLNTKYKQPTRELPQMTYYGDFDNQGHNQIVEVKREGDRLLPERGRSCSSNAMPSIKERFPSFHLFASAGLEDVYPPEKLKTAELYQVNEFQSGIFMNDHGKFQFVPLERLAQIAPGDSPVFADFNGDGNIDIFLAQNFYGPQIETPRYDGGCGQLLLGDGKGGFHPVEPRESGIVIVGDMRSASCVDLNGDGRPDIAVTLNNGPVTALLNQSSAHWLRVSVPPRNAPGVRLSLERAGKPSQLVELHAGSGYLSQEPAAAWFGLGDDTSAGKVRAVWSDGTSSEIAFDGKTAALQIAPPAGKRVAGK